MKVVGHIWEVLQTLKWYYRSPLKIPPKITAQDAARAKGIERSRCRFLFIQDISVMYNESTNDS